MGAGVTGTSRRDVARRQAPPVRPPSVFVSRVSSVQDSPRDQQLARASDLPDAAPGPVGDGPAGHQQRRRVLPREPAMASRPHSQARRGATEALGACRARARQRAGFEPMPPQGGRAAAGAPAFVDQGLGLVPAASAGGSLQCPGRPRGSGLPTAPCRVRASPAAGRAGRAAASAAHGDARTLRRSCSWREEIAHA
jgi:hypothetical protein